MKLGKTMITLGIEKDAAKLGINMSESNPLIWIEDNDSNSVSGITVSYGDLSNILNQIQAFLNKNSPSATSSLNNNKMVCAPYSVRDLREQKGMSQLDLAIKAKTTQRTISRIENGDRPGPRLSRQLAKIFGVSAKTLRETRVNQ
jgi:DNA-binding XRE family transcriptional regulator